jgi:hypothetical protein
MNYKIIKKTICPYGLVQQLDNLNTTAVKLNWVTHNEHWFDHAPKSVERSNEGKVTVL